MTVGTASRSGPALCGKGQPWDALASLEELFKRKLEEDSAAALPFAQERLLSWGCRAWPSPELRCSCPAHASAWPGTPLAQTQTNLPVWPGNRLIAGILPGDHWTPADPHYCLWAYLDRDSLTCVPGFTSDLPHHHKPVRPLHWTLCDLHSPLNLLPASRPALLGSRGIGPRLASPLLRRAR